ncbi:Imm61 family immunity protein [Cryobacterium sp. PH31-O1]|uniref:Imm61 family immunity protein n=1 Tax=Cryobacterium sp. PH31-O1 TaxID=3046306 RepID=UPI0024BA952D|nr:Imm61 family immunity protein [Cryobacterium sp. PH31-O1]MDJ0338452.1 Imm61 family immunity protein [Cryobacterium sp. PH31-O1]
MMVSERLEGLIEFASSGGWHWRVPPGTVFAFMTGDPDDMCTFDDGVYVVRKHERGVVSKPLIRSARLEDIDKYLSFRYGNTVRRKSGLPEVWLPALLPAEVGTSRDGFSFSGTPADMIVSWTDSLGGHEVRLNYRSAAEWVQYSRFSAQEIRDSFLDPEGSPVFDSRVQHRSWS